jgi:kynurenine formamidase
MNYSGTNPPYIESDALSYLISCGVKHFIIDLPSVDREEDEGKLAGHKAFWEYPETLNKNRTISELVYIDNEIIDGFYLLNLQIASFGIDVSPSKPVLYKLESI